jgi:dUTP pyrophosphatase
MTKDYTLEFFKCRDVKSPAKFGYAAGWDFFIPNDLTIFDFADNVSTYINEFVDFPSVNNKFVIPLEFGIKINDKEQVFIIVATKTEDGRLKPEIQHKPGDLIVSFFNSNKLIDNELEQLLVTPVSYIKILPGSKVLIPSGVHVKLPEQVFLVGENKSGIASKRGLIKAAQVIDNDYEGQIHINMINTNNVSVVVKSGEKLIQFIHTPILLSEFEVVDKETFDITHGETERGSGGFGSTGSN